MHEERGGSSRVLSFDTLRQGPRFLLQEGTVPASSGDSQEERTLNLIEMEEQRDQLLSHSRAFSRGCRFPITLFPDLWQEK